MRACRYAGLRKNERYDLSDAARAEPGNGDARFSGYERNGRSNFLDS